MSRERQTSRPGAEVSEVKKKRRYLKEIRSFLLRILMLVLFLFLLFKVFFGVAYAKNNDMYPRISARDLVFYYRFVGDVGNNEVVIIEKDGEEYIGRIVAQAGDEVTIDEENGLILNGNVIAQSDVFYETRPYADGPDYPITLGEGEYFILADYRDGAMDSRYYGVVSKDEIKGVTLMVIRRSSF